MKALTERPAGMEYSERPPREDRGTPRRRARRPWRPRRPWRTRRPRTAFNNDQQQHAQRSEAPAGESQQLRRLRASRKSEEGRMAAAACAARRLAFRLLNYACRTGVLEGLQDHESH